MLDEITRSVIKTPVHENQMVKCSTYIITHNELRLMTNGTPQL